MKKAFLLFALLFAPLAFGQTTYNVEQDSCGAKNLGFCTMNVTDQTGAPYQVVVDHRVTGSGPIDDLRIQTPIFPNTILYGPEHGTFSGFINPLTPHTPDQTGVITIDTDDGRVHAELSYRAHWVATCSGRGCAGASVGWHYTVEAGSQIVKQ